MTLMLSYDDVTLRPKYSDVRSRNDVDLSTQLGGFKLSIPMMTANMDTVTESEMAVAAWKAGGIGALHRFMPPEYNVIEYLKVRNGGADCFVSVGVNDWEQRFKLLFTAGARHLIIDIAHGHCVMMKETIEGIRKNWGNEVYIVAGNIATCEGALDLARWGANAIKVGIGAGSVCKTRVATGHGIPMFSSVLDCVKAIDASDYDVEIIADGGIKSSGDVVKALAAGADAVMAGSIFAGCPEAPGWSAGSEKKLYRGMASFGAQADKSHKNGEAPKRLIHSEGVEAMIEKMAPVSDVLDVYAAGIRSGFSYSGAHNIKDLWAKATWHEQSFSGHFEGTPHILAKK